MTENKKYSISIVVIGVNEEKLVGKCLSSLAKQEFNKPFEVIFVDGGSKDKTIEIVKTFANKFPLKITGHKIKTIGDARETGFRLTKAEIIASTDADVVLPTNWLKLIDDHFQRSTAVGVVGPYTSIESVGIWRTIIAAICRILDRTGGILCRFQPFRGLNFAIRRNVWLRAGGFAREVSAMEDADLALKASRFGKIDYLSDLVVLTTLRRFKRNLIRGTIYRLLAFYSRIYLRDYGRYTEWEQIRE